MNATPESHYLTIARIRKVQGRRGEVGAEILTDFPERFRPGSTVLVYCRGERHSLVLENSWFHKGLVILKFGGVENITAAETFVGAEVLIPREERFPLPAGTVYVADLIGCAVLENGQRLGTVAAVEETGATPLLQVLTTAGEILVPYAQEFCTAVDVEKKEIQVHLPEGLKELNRQQAAAPRRAAPARNRWRSK